MTTTTTTTTVLRRVRIAQGLTTIALAAAVPCSRMTLWRLEHGQRGAQPQIRAGLERVLGVPFDLLTAPDTQNGPAQLSEAAGVPLPPATTQEASNDEV